MDFDPPPGDRNWAGWISIWWREIEIGRDGFRSDARRSKLDAMDFDLVAGDRNWTRWIFDLVPGDRNRALTISRTLRLLGFPPRRSRFLPSVPDPDSLSSETVPECLENGDQVTAGQQLARSALRVPVPSSPAFAH